MKTIKKPSYKKTIADKNPDYMNKRLLLIDRERARLFTTTEGAYIQVNINAECEIDVFEMTNKVTPKETSLYKIGKECLGFYDAAVPKMLTHLVTPEMEIERIFNSLRRKYLLAVYFSEFDRPCDFINSKFNRAFQSMAGIKVYQGGSAQRKPNDEFWKEHGFKPTIESIDWKTDMESLGEILRLIKIIYIDDLDRIYKEMIAIKPGFHEMWLHDDFFDVMPDEDSHRDKVLRMLRTKEALIDLNLEKLPDDINRNAYMSYAACNITEGPFVFRKSLSASYFEEIRKIKNKEELPTLHDKFHILDYLNNRIETREQLEKVLADSEKFTRFI